VRSRFCVYVFAHRGIREQKINDLSITVAISVQNVGRIYVCVCVGVCRAETMSEFSCSD
jgi:hypothetical protein